MQAVDHLDGRRHLVDGGGQGLGGDIDELANAEVRVLVEGPGTAEVEAGEEVRVRGGSPPWTANTAPPVGTYSPNRGSSSMTHPCSLASRTSRGRLIPSTVPSTP